MVVGFGGVTTVQSVMIIAWRNVHGLDGGGGGGGVPAVVVGLFVLQARDHIGSGLNFVSLQDRKEKGCVLGVSLGDLFG